MKILDGFVITESFVFGIFLGFTIVIHFFIIFVSVCIWVCLSAGPLCSFVVSFLCQFIYFPLIIFLIFRFFIVFIQLFHLLLFYFLTFFLFSFLKLFFPFFLFFFFSPSFFFFLLCKSFFPLFLLFFFFFPYFLLFPPLILVIIQLIVPSIFGSLKMLVVSMTFTSLVG